MNQERMQKIAIVVCCLLLMFVGYQDLTAQEVTLSVTTEPLTRTDGSILQDDICRFQLVRQNGSEAWDFNNVINLPVGDDCVLREWKDDIAPGETARYRLRVIEIGGLKSRWTNIVSKTIPPLPPLVKKRPSKTTLVVE